jgi:hypothetical protein
VAYSILLGDLVTYCQQLANKPAPDGQLDTLEWKLHITTWFGRLHKTVTETGARCFETEATINLSNLALPTDHYQSIGVDLVLDSAGRRRELAELMVQERNLFLGQTGEAMAWALSGSSLALYPTPTTGTYKHLYIPQPTNYSTAVDATSVDVLTTDGLEAIGWGVASVGLHRSESQQQRAIDEAGAAMARLKEWAVERAKGIPKRRVITSVNARRSDIHGAWNPAAYRPWRTW